MEAIRSLVTAVEVQDPKTQGHHHRVTLYAQALLQALDPEGQRLSPLSLAVGTEHMDIGKIGVPDHILLKPEELTEEESVLLRKHPEVGRRILEPIIDDEIALEVVTSHHERWDGTGYPHGLVEDEIPLSARIAAVADSLDALTSSRSHRAALSWYEAVTQILEESGEKFDPEVIDAFQTALPRLREIWESFHEPSPLQQPDSVA
jgi:HD-GYP domain-containing protein (c-di-GMP phosphodiesterase class II)